MMNRLDNDSGRSNSRSSTDDVHSMCSQLSDLQVRSFPVTPRSIPHTQKSNLISKYEETAVLPSKTPRYSTIRLDKTHSVVEFAQFGEMPTFRKQAARSTNNPWRRYGAMRKLCETGGYAPNCGSKKERKKREQLVQVKNAKLPATPQCAQMSLNKSREPGVYERKLSLQVPKTVPVDLAAQALACQLKAFILENGMELLNEDVSSLKILSK